jgi:glutamate/aspartate transport system substrate-binding protein
MKRRAILGILLTTGLLAMQAHADQLTGRLARIKDSATMIIAHGETAMPFSYMDRNGPVGFGVDISKRIADGIKNRLNLADLRIRWNPVTLSTRFPLIVTNTVDLECVTTTHTRGREEMAGFSNSFYISDEGIAVRRDSAIKGLADLAGKRIAVVRGTTTERALQAKGLNATLVPERNNRMAMAALAEGRADAYVAAVPIIAGEFLRLADARPFRIISTGEYHEAFACMLPKNDPAFKKVVDDILAEMMKSGEMERTYNKWFMEPIPPFGRTVNLPLDEDNRQLYQAPNDKPFE